MEIRQGRAAGGIRSGGQYTFDRTLFRQRGDVECDVRILDGDGNGKDDFLIRTTGEIFVFYTGRR